MQGLDPVSRRRDHAFDLVIFALGDGHPDRVGINGFDGNSGDQLTGFIDQLDPGAQRGQQFRRVGMLERYPVALWGLLFTRAPHMDELPVVRQQDQPGGVLVEPANGLYAALAQLGRQQVEYRGVVLGHPAALKAFGLVEHQVGLLVVGPFFVLHGEYQTGRIDLGIGVFDERTIDGDQAGADQQATVFATAEALGLKEASDLHGDSLPNRSALYATLPPQPIGAGVLKFEHLVEVNLLDDPAVPDLSREEVWFGLLCRAEDPRPFLPGLDTCEVLTRSDTALTRRLSFGKLQIFDAVRWQAMDWICFESAATAEHPGGRLTITVEQPEPDGAALFLRFTYRTGLSETAGEDARYADYMRSAYHQSDIDTVKVVRMIAESTRTE